MDIIKEIKARLRDYPQAEFASRDNSITVKPVSSEGFTVSLVVNHDSLTVFFNGWHEDFQDQEEALNCFAFGLSADCRLKETQHGKVASKWTVEAKANGEWVEESTTGLLLFPFWMKKKTIYLQNTLISARTDSNNFDLS
jgi:hypothetical protein